MTSFKNSMNNNAGTIIMLGVENKNSSVEITVADNGIGIPAEHIDKIFQPFYRADRNASSSGGSGLGLAIVCQIVTLHVARHPTLEMTADANGASVSRQVNNKAKAVS